MQPWITSPAFVVEPQPSPKWPNATLVSPWVTPAAPIPQPYQTDENLKKAFGIELAKNTNAFAAACVVFGEETNKALWASFNWLTDPLVIASRDIYAKTIELSKPSLDREQLAAKVLALAEGEKILNNNGIMVPTIEAKDRLGFFKLYSDILGYTGKVEIDNSKNMIINEMTIKLVKADTKEQVTINNAPNVKSEIQNNASPITLKLVKAS